MTLATTSAARHPAPSPPVQVGFDVGGTFTDIVLTDAAGRLRIEKTLTTPQDPSVAARHGIEALLAAEDRSLADLDLGVHGTTLVTNAIIEARGAVTAVLTTAGFEDLLEIGGGTRYDLYDLQLAFRPPLVERRLRRGVAERVDPAGNVRTALDEDEVLATLGELVEAGVEALAVCFLHAYANPLHERRVAELAAAHHPRLAVSLSSEIAPELGEYVRLSTTAANAYVAPLVDRYLDALRRWIAPAELLLMGSSGGTLSVETARRRPIALIESGPAAGALAASDLGRRIGRDRVLSFDMGGTTAKVCVIDDARPATAADFEAARVERFKPGSGIPLRVAVINLIEIGAGGGSLARIDELGLLKVGPRSAGAEPGPACYGLGGELPTVTDANLVLGYLAADSFLGGEMRLDAEAARRALADHVGAPLELDATQAAWGVHDLVNESMASAMRTHVAERNRDIRRYSVVAFGGAGPVHAVAVARKVGIGEVVVPLGAGAMSAIGLLGAPPAVDLARSQPARLDELDWAQVELTLRELEEQARRELASAHVAAADVVFEHAVEMRYAGQAQEITVPLALDGDDRHAALRAAFERAYAERYTLLNPDFAIEVLSWRLHARGPRRELAIDAAGQATHAPSAGEREIWVDGAYRPVPVHTHELLPVGCRVEGPAVVEQRETTTVLGAGDVGVIDAERNLVIALGQEDDDA